MQSRYHAVGRFVWLAAMFAALVWGNVPALAQSDQTCFTQTGYCVGGRIRQFWQQNGGLPVFGYPISAQGSEQTADGTFVVQRFERARLELHPEQPAPYDVELGRLGVDSLVAQGRDYTTFPKADTSGIQITNCQLFPETQHTVCGEFLSAFGSYGLAFPGVRGISFEESLALFGLPLSQATTERTPDGQELLVQHFERARFELHPENELPYRVLFGRLGAELAGEPMSNTLVGTQWRLESFAAAGTSTPAVGESPADLAFGGDGRATGSSGCNGFSGQYQATADSVTFGPLAATLKACEPNLAAQEKAVFAILQGSLRYAQSNGKLVLTADAGVLTYRPLATLSGTVTYRQRSALPENAVITVRLQDVSRADAPAITLAEQTITPTGQVPVPFTLAYDPAAIDQRMSYSVRAEIRVGDQLVFTTTQSYPVITRGNPMGNVEIVVQPV